MEDLLKKDLMLIFRAGSQGSVPAFARAASRFLLKLKQTDRDFASQLARLVPQTSALRGAATFVPAPVDVDSRQELVETIDHVFEAEVPQVDESVASVLGDILEEWQHTDRLVSVGLTPVRTVLLSGPPGVGKTMTAHWIANQLELPLVTLNLATVMSSYLGKTGNNIRSVFKYATQRPCVFLLDEFDAVAKRRDDDSDVGELKRLVNVLLQEMDDWPVGSLLVAATNHHELLDPAVWRRFDHVLHYALPTFDRIASYLERFDELGLTSQARYGLAKLLEGLNFSAIRQIVLTAKKSSLLRGEELPRAFLRQVVANRADGHPNEHVRMLQMRLEGCSLREIAAAHGMTHPTASKIIKSYLGDDSGKQR